MSWMDLFWHYASPCVAVLRYLLSGVQFFEVCNNHFAFLPQFSSSTGLCYSDSQILLYSTITFLAVHNI
uniref:Uncharacterized protein n=1 Tax=Octopus bimaculoides TaxID=37653 RepID=A0A0L8HN55_OCTBM